MDFLEYQNLIKSMVTNKTEKSPYNQEIYVNYTKLSNSRINRWLKQGEINTEIKSEILKISSPLKWILITEPWCGDAAHSYPFILMLSQLSEFIDLEIQLRDTDSEIDNYLTNNGKSIPILIIRNEQSEDLAVWGPRPAQCKDLYLKNLESDLSQEDQKIELQNWYNEDKGVSIQNEILEILKGI